MHTIKLFLLIALSTALSGCFSGTAEYTGISFPATPGSKIVIQESDIPDTCSAFAHLLMTTKENSTGQEISTAIKKEAEQRGANLILIGLSRENESNLGENRFEYHGPSYSYNFNKTWLGWKFGFDTWNNAGPLVGLGSNSMGNSEVNFKNSLMIQAVFLRCGDR